jgi:hypothetical protein
MFATLLSWMALHVRSDTAKEIESSSCAINWPCCSDAHHDRRSAGATAPSSPPSPGYYRLLAAADFLATPQPRSCDGTATSSATAGPPRPSEAADLPSLPVSAP